MQLKRLIVIGAGAIGGSIGGLLHESGFPTVFVTRGEHGRTIRKNGLDVRMPDRGFNIRPECFEQIADVSQHGNGWQAGDAVMVATKLNDAQSVMDELLASAGSHIPVIMATNGVHGERWAQMRFENVISMMVWMPATHLHPGEVRLHGSSCRGILDNGPCGDQPNETMCLSEELSQRLKSVGFDAVPRADIDCWKHAKWITNLGSAAQAMVTDDWRTVASAAREEGIAVFAKAKLDYVPKQELLARCQSVDVSQVDGQDREGGSTWQSRQRGKPLESRWIEGAMADLADEVGIPAPINRFLSDASFEPQALLAKEILAQETGEGKS